VAVAEAAEQQGTPAAVDAQLEQATSGTRISQFTVMHVQDVVC
jgi:hypothetical protein